MDTPQNNLRLSCTVINSMLDDLIEMKCNSINKSNFRYKLISKRLDCMNMDSGISPKDIENSISILKENKESEYKLSRALKQVFETLNRYQNQLIVILNKLR